MKGSYMKFISWNVNGFRACLQKGFSDFFAAADADFFCIQETKMQPGQADFETPDHVQYWYSAQKKGYSGTVIFTDEPLISERLSVSLVDSSSEISKENGKYPPVCFPSKTPFK